MTTSTKQRNIEIIFLENAHDGDIQILTPATSDQPGRAKLGAARIEPVPGVTDAGRLMSGNGGGLIGLIGYGEPEPPFTFSYLVEEAGEEVSDGQAA